MANLIYNSPLDHSSDAGFRAWGKELSDALQACGLVKTGDTGQINWSTANRPGINVKAGYEVYYLNDSMHATAPLYFKIEYGTGSSYPNMPGIWYSLGKGSDGAGNLVSPFFESEGGRAANTTSPTPGSHPTYVCVVDGAFWFSFKPGSVSANASQFFFLARSVGADGEPSAEGVTVLSRRNETNLSRQNSPQFAVYDYASQVAFASELNVNRYSLSTVWGAVTSSLVASSPQVYKHYTLTPRVRPNPYLLTVLPAEIGVNSQFEAQVISGRPRTYISLPGESMGAPAHNASTSYTAAPVWE